MVVFDRRRPWGIIGLSIFFWAGAAISLTACISLLLPKRFLASMWRVNPRAHENLSSIGIWTDILLFTVSIFCAAAAIGLCRGERWGHWFAVGLIVVNLIGDVTKVLLGIEPRAIAGAPNRGGNIGVSNDQEGARVFQPMSVTPAF